MKKRLLSIVFIFIFISGCTLAQEPTKGEEHNEEDSLYVMRGMVFTFDYQEPDLDTIIKDKEGIFFYVDTTKDIDGVKVTQLQIGNHLRSSGIHYHFGHVEIDEKTVETLKIEGTFTLYYHAADSFLVTPFNIYQNKHTNEYKLEPATSYYLSGYSSRLNINIESEYTLNDKVIDAVDFEVIFEGIETLTQVQAFVLNGQHEVVDTYDIDLSNPQPLTVDEDHYLIIEETYQETVERYLIEENKYHPIKVINAHGFADITHIEINFE